MKTPTNLNACIFLSVANELLDAADSGDNEMGCCTAISLVASDATQRLHDQQYKKYYEISRKNKEINELFRKWYHPSATELPEDHDRYHSYWMEHREDCGSDEAHARRVLAMCFMATLCEVGDA